MVTNTEAGALAPSARVLPATRDSVRSGRGLRRGRARMLAATDTLALVLGYEVTYLAANMISPPAVIAPTWGMVLLGSIAWPTWLLVFAAYRLYDNDGKRITVSSFDEIGDVFHALIAGSLGFLLLSQVMRRIWDWQIFSAIEALLFVLSTFVLVPLGRGALRSWVFPRVMQKRRALIVGTGADAALVQRKLAAHPEYGLETVGFLAGDEELAPGVIGVPSHLTRLVDELEIDRVLLTSAMGDHEQMLDLVRTVRRPDVQVSIVPRYFEIFTSHAILDDVEGMPLVTLPPMRLERSSRLLKRLFDIVVAGAILLLLAPLLALIAVAIRIEDRGPSFYRQPRRGRMASTFSIVKFRTMVVGAEARRENVLHLNEVDGPLFKIKGRDPRVTRIGAFLRRTSLDELPQLWNVLRGEMSLVGPRPFVVYEADQITGWASRRLDMTPGITGLWQVLGRNDIPFDEMVKLDYLYVTNWSLWWDLKLLCQTVPVVLGRRGAY
jgi:exopolysaccharide biosynthesis polyprenyl glycosylphosphotransferase